MIANLHRRLLQSLAKKIAILNYEYRFLCDRYDCYNQYDRLDRTEVNLVMVVLLLAKCDKEWLPCDRNDRNWKPPRCTHLIG